MRKQFLLLFCLLPALLISAQTKRDTVSSFYAGPGILYSKIIIPSAPWIINVLEMNAKNPAARLETVKSGDVMNGVREAVPSMAERHNSDGHYVIGAVNGDFFSGNNPIQMQVKNGEILKRQRTDGAYAAIAFNYKNEVEFASPVFSGSVTAGKATMQISGVNEARAADKLVMYNALFGPSTNTSSGTEAALHPLKEWFVNDTVYCVVDSVNASVGNMSVKKGAIVLSGTGTAANFIASNLKPGDTVKVFTKATGKLKQMKELMGGHPFIMKNGAISTALDLNDPLLKDRHPRTIVGINKDTTKIFIVVVDGRSAASMGMNVWEMVDFMKSIGAYEVVNLDGGGSTTMTVRNQVVNTPSDGQLRGVANGLMIVSTVPAGKVAKLNIFPKKVRLYKGETASFSFIASDMNDNPVFLQQSLVNFNVSPSLGAVDNSGKFTAGTSAASGYVYIKYNDAVDSAFVIVKSVAALTLSPKKLIADDKRKVQINPIGFDIDNIERIILPSEVVWKSDNPSIAVIDTNGYVIGKSEGSTRIIATYMNTLKDTAEVAVQIGNGISVLDQMDISSSWLLSGSNIDTLSTRRSILTEIKNQGAGSIKIDYKFTYDPSIMNYVYLDNDITVYGIPDSMFIDTRSDGTSHKLYFIFSDENDELFRVNAYGYINTNGYFNTVPVPLKNFAAVGSGKFFYPVRLKRIEIQLQYNNPARVTGQTYSGTIYLDNLRVKYPAGTTGVYDNDLAVREYSLKQNYPNPFNPSTMIEFSLPGQENVILKVYDLLGREISVLVNGKLNAGRHRAVWNSEDNASGIYFYRLQTGSFNETRKMLLIR